MPAQNPEDLDRLFEDYLNRGDVDAILTLYEPGAAMPGMDGSVAVGTAALRQAIEGFAAMKPQIDLKVDKAVQTGDLALVYSSWSLKGKGPDGNPMQMSGKGREVARRQPDGTWLFAIDDPMGGM